MYKESSALGLIPFPVPVGWVEGVSKLGGDWKFNGAESHGC